MKLRLFVLSATVFAASCNTSPKATETKIEKKDTIITTELQAPAVKEEKQTTQKSSTTTTSESGAMSSESDNTAKKKSGWSKTAKGAVIGGVAGAGTGAVINKKDRVKGAIVGGVVGAGTGAIIGNEMDKKDGRH
jgi:hypothetical protein